MRAADSVAARPDRRAGRRYHMETALRYLARSGDTVVASGEGLSANISSAGLLFRNATAFSPGTWVTAGLHWEFAGQGDPPLLLVLAGPIMRSTSQETAMRNQQVRVRSRSQLSAGESEDCQTFRR